MSLDPFLGRVLPGKSSLLLLAGLAFLVQDPSTQEAPPAPQDPPAKPVKSEEPDARFWDEMFQKQGATELHGADTFPVYCVQRLLREKKLEAGAGTLVVAMGDGRNAVALAREGLDVTGIDISTVAIEKARKAAEEHGLTIHAIEADMYKYDLGTDRWDLLTNIYYNPAVRILDKFKAAVRPGGYLLVEGFGADHKSGGPPAWSRYRPNQLLDELKGWRILEYQDGVFHSDWARSKPAPVVRVLAQKPEAAEPDR